MKKLFLILFINFLIFGCFAKEIGISILTNPIYVLYDIGYAFADNTAETFQIAGDLEVQIPLKKQFELSIYQNMSFDRYLESYAMNSEGIINGTKALQVEYKIEPGLSYIFNSRNSKQSAPFVTVFPVLGIVDIHSKQNKADFFVLGAGIIGGYQWKFPSGFTLKLYSGLSKSFEFCMSEFTLYKRTNDYNFLNIPFDLRIECRIGFSI